MTYSLENIAKIHINIMENLVNEEIEKQLKFYPKNIKNYINKVEVATYALNRLPALYASSTLGKEQQKRMGQHKYKAQITLAVRRALAAIERDPLRQSTPLVSEIYAQYQLAEISLKRLEKILKEYGMIPDSKELSWNNLNTVINRLFIRLNLKTNEQKDFDFQGLTYLSNEMNIEFFNIPKNPYKS